MLVDASLDDVVLTSAFTGLPANMLRPAIVAAGLDPDLLHEQVTPAEATEMFGARAAGPGPKRWSQVYSAGHTVSAVHAVQTAAEIVEQTEREYRG